MIVPDGVLFGSSKAHLTLRKILVDENQLEGVISLPSGVFKPYAGVSTAIIVFTKGGTTESVYFYKVDNDGYTLDDKREEIDENDIIDLPRMWTNRQPERDIDRELKAFFIQSDKIRSNKYDLSFNRYEKKKYVEEVFEDPSIIIDRMQKLEDEIRNDLDDLRRMVS